MVCLRLEPRATGWKVIVYNDDIRRINILTVPKSFQKFNFLFASSFFTIFPSIYSLFFYLSLFQSRCRQISIPKSLKSRFKIEFDTESFRQYNPDYNNL